MSSFPSNPVDGTIIEIRPGEFHIFNASTQSWTRIDGYKFGLASSKSAGLMSNEDLKKLNSLILPPPSSSLTGESCDIVFKNGTVSLYSTDESLSIKHDLSVNSGPSILDSQDYPWQISENTAGYDFKLNLNKLVEEIESRGKLSKIQLAGPDGARGPIGEKGLDNLDTGPVGIPGLDGSNSPFSGFLSQDELSIAQLKNSKNRAIVSIENETINDENYLVITRANIGDPEAAPDRVAPKNFESPWVLVLDKQEGKITRKIISEIEDCTLSCKVSVSSIYYLNIDGIIEALKERYEYKLAELKSNKELLVKSWLRVMSIIYNEQKYALCCALENCETRNRNTEDRRWIESQRIQATIGNMGLTISSNDGDKVVSEKGNACPIDEETDGQDSERITYGQECDDYLVKIRLDARIHNKNPKKSKKYGYLSVKLPAGDYQAEIIDCCANFAAPISNSMQIPGGRRRGGQPDSENKINISNSSNSSGLQTSNNSRTSESRSNSTSRIGAGFSNFRGPGGAVPVGVIGARPPNRGPAVQPAPKCNASSVFKSGKIGKKPGDSVGILKADAYEKYLTYLQTSGAYYDMNYFPFDASKNPFSLENDYLQIGYIGADCRVVYNPLTEIIGNQIVPDYRNINRVGSDLEKLFQFYKKKGHRINMGGLDTLYTLRESMRPVFLSDNLLSGLKQTEAVAIEFEKMAKSGIAITPPSSTTVKTLGPNQFVGTGRERFILGGSLEIPGAGEKVADCEETEDCADPPVRIMSRAKGKWTGKVGISIKTPSINFRLREGAIETTEPTAGAFEEYQDYTQLIEREIYLPPIADSFFETITEAANTYSGSNTLFSHAGGIIKIWISDPTEQTDKSSYDGGVTVGIKSKKCVEIPQPSDTTEVTAASIPVIYIYRNKISNDNIIGFIKPYVLETKTHAENYSDANNDVSLIVGPGLEADTSKMFFVLASDGLGFYHVHNIKNNELSTSIFSTYITENNIGNVQPILGGPATLVPDQLAEIYKASWSIENDAKGIVFSEFSGDDWTLTLDELNFGKIKNLVAHDGASGTTYTLAKNEFSLSSQTEEETKDFMLCRALFRACNVPEALGGKYSLGIINRSRESFRICRILPEWKVPEIQNPPSADNVWIQKPVTYSRQTEPCGASVCDVRYQVIAGTDGKIVPLPVIDQIPENLADLPLGTANSLPLGTDPDRDLRFVDNSLDGKSLDFLLLVNSRPSLKTKIDKLAKNLRTILDHFALRGVSNIRVGVARFGTVTRELVYNISEILRDQPFKRFRLGFLQTPRYLEDYDFYEYGKGKFLPINGIQPNVGENFYTLTGYVYDNTSTSPLPVHGALVHLRLPFFGNKIIQSSITDENGMYAFKINSAWPYEIRYDQFGNVIPNAEIEVNLYNSSKMNGSWTFDQYSKNSSYRQYLQINGEWKTNQETQIPYTEDGNSIISLIPISQPNRNSAQQFVAAGMIIKDIKVESIDGENRFSFKIAIDDDATDADFNDFESRVSQKIAECPTEVTSNLEPIISKRFRVAIGPMDTNSNFGYEIGEIQAGPIFTIDKPDAEDIIASLTCGSTTTELQEEVPDFEILQSFTYNIDSAVQALESIQYRSEEETTSAGFAAIKRASEKMPWFSNAVKMMTIISDIDPNTNQLSVSLKEQEELTSGDNQNPITDITIPSNVKFVPVQDIILADPTIGANTLCFSSFNLTGVPTPHNWETNNGETSNLYSSIGKFDYSTTENEDDFYIRTTELKNCAHGYITKLNSLIDLDTLYELNDSQFEYTTVKLSIRLRSVSTSEDPISLICRVLSSVPYQSIPISSINLGVLSVGKLDGASSTQVSRLINNDYFDSWSAERGESVNTVLQGIITAQQSSPIADVDDLGIISTGSPEIIDLQAGNWQTITTYLVVKKSELLNGNLYVQISAVGGDSALDTSETIDGRFEISNLLISFEDSISPILRDTSVTAQEALNELNSKKIILNGIVQIDKPQLDYEIAEIRCDSNKYRYSECEYIPLGGNNDKIVIVEAWVIKRVSKSSIKFVAGNKPVNQRNGPKRGPDGRYCNNKSCGEFGIKQEEDGSSKIWVDHGARGVFGIKYYRLIDSRIQKPSPINVINENDSGIRDDSYGIPYDPSYPLRPSPSGRFGSGLAYQTGGALFDIEDINNSSNYYGIPEWQEPINDNPDGVFVLETEIDEIIEDEFGSRKWRLSYDTTGLPPSNVPSRETRATYLVGKYKNQNIKNVTVVQNEYPNSQLPAVENHTNNSLNSDPLLGNDVVIRFGNLSDDPEYTRAISIKRGYKGILEYQLTPDVYSPINQYKAEPSVDIIQDARIAFPENAKTTVYQPFWRFSIGLNASEDGAYGQNNLSNVDTLRASEENGFYTITGQVFDGSTINRTPGSGVGGNGSAYVYGGLVNLTIPSISDQVICSSITDIQGQFALKVPKEWLAPVVSAGQQTSSWTTDIEAIISIPVYSQQTNDEWQLEPSILGDESLITRTNRRYRTIGQRIPSNFSFGQRFSNNIGWRRLISINDSRFTKESVNSYITNQNIKSITIQSFFTDPRNYDASRGPSGLILNQNLVYSSSFMRIENIEFNQSNKRFTFKIKSDDGGFNTTSKKDRERGDLLFNDSFIVVSHPQIPCASQNMDPYVTISRNITISTIDGDGFTNIGAIVIPEEDDLSSETMKCGAFFQKFAIEKYREFLTRIPRITSDCLQSIRGGRAVNYIKVAGVPLTQEVYEGTVVEVIATMQSLPGQFIKAIVYDVQGRGLVLRGVETSISSIWETLSWNTENVESYINPLASTTQGYDALISMGYDPNDPRLQNTQSRANLLTSELSIKLKDLLAISLEWNNPDLGIVSFINDIKVAVESIGQDGSKRIVYVDIANFEAFGKNVTDPGEIPLAIFAPKVTNEIPGNPGGFAETTFFLDATDVDNQTGIERKIIDNSSIQIGKLYSKVYFKEVIVPYSEDAQSRLELGLSLGYGPNRTPPTAVVKIGATDADTLKNLEKLINNSGTNGIEYYDPYIPTTGFSLFIDDIEAYPASERSIRIKAKTSGVQGNFYGAHLNIEETDPLTGMLVGQIFGAAFGSFYNGVWYSTNRFIAGPPNSIIQQGYMTAMNGGVDEVQPSGQTVTQPTEEDESAYLENWWTITKADNFEQPCVRWKEYCQPAVIYGDNCQRIEIDNRTAMTSDLNVPLSKYILTPRCPFTTCEMHHKQVEWYERGWRIGACCGALVEIDGVKWIVVKRSIGIDVSCGGGESEENPCIKQAIENGEGHPAIAWPTINGEEFIGRPTSGFARFTKDQELSNTILSALLSGSAIEYRGNMTFNDVNDKIPFILFPKS